MSRFIAPYPGVARGDAVGCVFSMIQAPRTCQAVWDGLIEPQENPAWHAKHSGSEVYAPGPSFIVEQPPLENATFTR